MNWRKIGMISGIIGGILAFAVSWIELDLPRLALHSEVAGVEQFSRGTRTLVLYQQKKQVLRELAITKSRLRKSPGNRDLLRQKVDLEIELDLIIDQLKALAPKKR